MWCSSKLLSHTHTHTRLLYTLTQLFSILIWILLLLARWRQDQGNFPQSATWISHCIYRPFPLKVRGELPLQQCPPLVKKWRWVFTTSLWGVIYVPWFFFIQDEDSLALSSQGSTDLLDPLLDSFDAEFGYDWTGGGHHPHATGQSSRRPLHAPAQPSPLTTTSTRATSQSSRTRPQTSQLSTTRQGGTGYSQGFLPPPTYQAAVDGSDGGITTAGGGGYEWPIVDEPTPLGGQPGPRSNSTPLIREGMRRRGPRQGRQQQEQASQEENNIWFDPNSHLLQELDTL